MTAAFFGYARQGALAVPALAVVAGVGLAALHQRHRWLLLVPAAVIAVDVARWLASPTWFIDGHPWQTIDPWPVDVHADRRIELRW